MTLSLLYRRQTSKAASSGSDNFWINRLRNNPGTRAISTVRTYGRTSVRASKRYFKQRPDGTPSQKKKNRGIRQTGDGTPQKKNRIIRQNGAGLNNGGKKEHKNGGLNKVFRLSCRLQTNSNNNIKTPSTPSNCPDFKIYEDPASLIRRPPTQERYVNIRRSVRGEVRLSGRFLRRTNLNAVYDSPKPPIPPRNPANPAKILGLPQQQQQQHQRQEEVIKERKHKQKNLQRNLYQLEQQQRRQQQQDQLQQQQKQQYIAYANVPKDYRRNVFVYNDGTILI